MMSSYNVPHTMRDTFLGDPFFCQAFGDLNHTFKKMQKESRRLWRQEVEAAKNLQQQLEHQQKNQPREIIIQQQQQQQTGGGFNKNVLAECFDPHFHPKRWLLPRLLSGEDELSDKNQHNLHLFQQDVDHTVIRLTNDANKFELSLDTHGYKPQEVHVNIEGGTLTVEGKQETRKKDEYSSKMFRRSYVFPEECVVDQISSNLSSDGVLMVTAPKKVAVEAPKTPAVEEKK